MEARRFDIRIACDGRVLVDIRDFLIPLNRITFLFGESGIGKSLIARAIYGLLDPEEFDIVINGDSYDDYLAMPETEEFRRNSFFVFQEPSSHLNPLVQLAIQLREGSLAKAPDEESLLRDLWDGAERLEIENLLNVYPKPYRPSGGEKQRMFLVMALKKIDIALQNRHIGEKSCFVFDEPTGSLDNRSRDCFLALLLKRFNRQPFTTLLITHDYSMVSEVTHSYKSLLPHISFKELRLHRQQLALREFQPETYLGWLSQRRLKQKALPVQRSEGVLLRVESGIEVFGQRLTISKDPADTKRASLEIRAGSLTYLKAPSGTGKTTVVKLIMGLLHADKLRITIDGTVLTEKTPRSFWRENLWGRRMTLVFQHADEALNPRSTVAETFQGLPSQGKITQSHIQEVIKELFDDEPNDDFLNKKVNNLSGGQKQRLNLLRSLFLDTAIIILDEPLNGLDLESIERVLAMVQEKLDRGKGILLISHNEEIFDAVVSEDNVYYLHSSPLHG